MRRPLSDYKFSHISKWLLRGGISLLLYASFLPGRFVGPSIPFDLIAPSETGVGVFLCRRLVDDWRAQLLLPGVEHYSIWLPARKLHRGLTAEGPGEPLQWVDEIYLEPQASAEERVSRGLTCHPLPNANLACVERSITRRQDEGRYGPTNHCQHKVVEILVDCQPIS